MTKHVKDYYIEAKEDKKELYGIDGALYYSIQRMLNDLADKVEAQQKQIDFIMEKGMARGVDDGTGRPYRHKRKLKYLYEQQNNIN